MKKIYFDYAATTPVAPEVLKAMAPYFSEKFGNPGSLHSFGQETLKAIDESREKIAETINADFREIIFTGSATEANNLALRGAVKNFNNALATAPQNQNTEHSNILSASVSSPSARQVAFGDTKLAAPAGCSLGQSAIAQNFSPLRIIISVIEHESILETARDLEKEGVEVIYLPVDKNGFVDLKKLKESLNEWTILVSIMYVNNVIGTVQPIKEIAKIINDFKKQKSRISNHYPLFHTDAVQAFQYLDCDVNSLGVDLMTLSAHKIYGSKGIGALYLTNKIQPLAINPIITGGGQEFGLRSGTENVPAIVGFAKAIELAVKNREKETKRIAKLADYFWQELKKNYPSAQLNNNFNQKQTTLQNQNTEHSNILGASVSSPHILNIYFPNQRADDLLIKLDLAGVAVSSGAACSARAMKPSYVLKAIGLSEQRIKSSLRFSFGKFTAKKEIDEALKRIL